MAGKILLVVLFVILALLLMALLIPVYVRVSYERGEWKAVLKYAKFARTLPAEKSSGEEEQEENTKKSQKEKKKPGKENKPRKKPTWSQIQYSLDTLPGVILKALKRTGRRMWFDPLKVHVLVATSDPADTAILYGKLEAFLAAFLPMLHRSVKIREQDIRLFPDFSEENMDLIADVGVHIRPISLLVVALQAAGGVLRWYISFSRLAKKAPSAEENNKRTTASAEPSVDQP